MAVSANTTWEVRTTGSDSSGGGFVTGAAGTDYSQQDAAQYSGTNLSATSATGAAPVISSATHNFVAADVGNIIQITAGTNWTTGFYQIVSVASNNGTLDRACASVASPTSGTFAVGGALLSPGKAAGATVTSNTIWIKSGTYSITSATTNVAAGCMSVAVNVYVEGYQTSRGDRAARPLLQAGNAISAFTICGSVASADCIYINIAADGATLTTSKGFSPGRGICYLCKALNCTNSGFSGVSTCVFILCHATGCSTVAAFNETVNPGIFIGCEAYSNTITGFSMTRPSDSCSYCLSYNNSGASSDGFSFSSIAGGATNCIAYNNGRDGFRFSSNNNYAINCIAEANVGKGFDYTAGGSGNTASLVNCAGFNNGAATSGTFSQNLNFKTLTASPFVNAGASNFALNINTCRAGGILGAFPAGTSTGFLDVGAVQHKDPARKIPSI